jgi:hypothetical protein
VDERVGPRMDPWLGRQLDAPCADCAIRLFDEIEVLGDRGEEARDLVPSQIEQAHISWTRTGSTTTLMRSSPRRHG